MVLCVEQEKILKAEIFPELGRLCIDKIPGKDLSEVIHYLVCGNQNAGKSDDAGSGRNILHIVWGCRSLMKRDSDEFFLNFLF